jgi:protein-S-isoprenylcysteine O-methyltransferase Ste14/DNA-binding PadR family transcriptional regulator
MNNKKKNKQKFFQHTSGRRKGKHEYGQSWMLAAALLDGPRTREQLENYYRIMGRRFGLFVDLLDHSKQPAQTETGETEKSKLQLNVERGLQILLKRGWAVEKKGYYHITDQGQAEAELMLKDMERGCRIMDKATQPKTVSKVTLIVHFLLAAIKLPAALLSGSVGLLNDSLDTLMDGVSSLFVFLGVRSGRERLVSFVLLLFMTLTGLYTFYEAVDRIIHPETLTADWTAFIAVFVSAGLCALLWFYQKYSGLKHSCVPLIAQSIDSRNHILVAGGVAAGLIASYFHFTLLDQIVGITVAVLILKGAFEFFIDLIRTGSGEEIDFSKYGFSLYDRYRHRQMIRWFLFEIEKGRITTREEMLREAKVATDYQQIASLKALGLDKKSEPEEKLEKAIQEIFDKGFAVEKNAGKENHSQQQRLILQLTPAGEEELNRALSNNWSSHGHFPSFSGGGLLGLLAFSLHFLVTVVVFIVTYALVRWVLGFLPSLDIWETGIFLSPGYESAKLTETAGSWLLSIMDFLKTVLLSRTYTIGPFSLSGAQGLGILLGVVLLYRGRILLHQARHVIQHARENDVNRPFYLITDGLFSVRRHPMYAGLILIDLGIGIWLHSVYTLAWAGLSIIFRLVSARVEERKLAEWFGQEYKEYRKQVKKYFFSWWGWVIIISIYTVAWVGM